MSNGTFMSLRLLLMSSIRKQKKRYHIPTTCSFNDRPISTCKSHRRYVLNTPVTKTLTGATTKDRFPSSSSLFAIRHLSSSTSTSSPNASFSIDKEEHNRKVAAAQALVFARLQQQDRKCLQENQKRPTSKEQGQQVVPLESDIANSKSTTKPAKLPSSEAERTNVLKNISHWLSKDPSFFFATMNNNNNNIINKKKKNDINHFHPIQSVWNQYRQLYHESIPDFVTEWLEKENSNDCYDFDDNSNNDNKLSPQVPSSNISERVFVEVEGVNEFDDDYDNKVNNDDYQDNFNTLFQELISVGFGDPKLSQKFRKERRYQLSQDQLSRHIVMQRNELKQLQNDLVTARAITKRLEDKLININADDNEIKNYNCLLNNNKKLSKKKRRFDRRRNHRLQTNTEQISQQVENEKNTQELSPLATSMSFFQRSWAALSSSLWGQESSPPSSSNAIIDVDPHRTVSKIKYAVNETDMEKRRYNSYEPISKKVTQKSHNYSNNNHKLRKRVRLKNRIADDLQKAVNGLSKKIQRNEQTKLLSKSPIPIREYEHLQNVVAKARDSICSEFARHIQGCHTKLIEQYQTLDSKTDLTKPHEWYSYARLDRRKIVYHGGPTNSGKTYSALQRLKEAEKGLYLGPLRLLAAEVYETLTADGLYTNLYTGQERRDIAFSTHAAATVEMCNVNEEYDIVVIDEIQMISDVTRGASWTKALMGLRCKEIHVCGGFEAVDIVKKIAGTCGDDFELNRYERFTDLKVSRKSLARHDEKAGAYKNVQQGDCIVAFSRNDIFAIKREIESMTKYKCCVVYGKLPPETRADQARRFNDPDSGYDILVASDAIGMGLNLNIKRIIFNSIFKFNGEKIVRLNHSEIKQIGGRAGRRNSPYPNGEVLCRDSRDLGYIRRCLTTEIEPIRKAGLLPTEAHIELFSEAMHAYNRGKNGHPDLHEILRQFSAMATVKGDFFLGRQTEMATIAKRLKNIPIRLRDAYAMCLSPITESSLNLLENFAMKVSQGEVCGLPSRPVPKKAKTFGDLTHLCNIYADVDLFMWLQYKFPPSNQVEVAAALARREQTMEYINVALSSTDKLELNHCYLKAANRHRISWDTSRENQGSSSRTNNSVASSFVNVDDDEKFVLFDDDYVNDEEEYNNYKDIDAVKYL